MKHWSLFILIILLAGCGKENPTASTFKLNEPFEIPYQQVFHNNDQNVSIYLDSVLYDSRCPLGFLCTWEGNALVRFRFISNHTVNDLLLNTFKDFRNDTIINGYKISMVSLAPQPRSGVKTEQQEYKATMVINN